MNAYTFNKKWGKYGYNFYYVKCNGKYIGMLRNMLYNCIVCRDMTADKCDKYLTKNRYSLEFKLMAEMVELDI